MLLEFVKKIFGTANSRFIKKLTPDIDKINKLDESYTKLTDKELSAKTLLFKERIKKGENLDDILTEAFATVREAAKRTLGERHYDVQLIGGIVLHRGMISEMKTGEGKTLVSTLPAYLNALTGKGVHIVTVNDYLAKRDSEWMGQIYKFLGLKVGCIVHGMNDSERKEAYSADITYATNNELGFDYLRDNMKFESSQLTQRPFNFAIVDEVDSILIDEARTPLVISGPSQESSNLYKEVDDLIKTLSTEDFEKDEKIRSVTLTDKGVEKVEKLLTNASLLKEGKLHDIQNVGLVHHVNQALKAHQIFQKDKDYLVKNEKVVIVDEFTGRMMEGRRFSDGLHQALEAKEGVKIEIENQTLASITFQNYFRLYPKISGMTGTALTEAGEFSDIYKLDVVEIPTNVSIKRIDEDDEIYRTTTEKEKAITNLISDCHKRKQPVLVGTITIEKSERLSDILKKGNIPHNVLNARYHEQEAQIIAQAGVPGSVTIATNMAGRGVDIQMGGNLTLKLESELSKVSKEEKSKLEKEIKEEHAKLRSKAIAAGGLYVMGTERHESRRIDNQLRGRSGRQGDSGKSKFFLSLEDDLMRIFGSERLDAMLQKLGIKENEAIIHPWINKALEKAQKKVEGRNFEIRKSLLRFDDVMNDQRKVIYQQRKEIMSSKNIRETVESMRGDVLDDILEKFIPKKSYPEQWDRKAIHAEILRIFNLDLTIKKWTEEEGITKEIVRSRIQESVDKKLKEKDKLYSVELMNIAEKNLLLQILDQIWKDHLLSLDHLKQGIGLRAYGQKDPLNEYKMESFEMFKNMLDRVKEGITGVLCHLEIQTPESVEKNTQQEALPSNQNQQHANQDSIGSQQNAKGNGKHPNSKYSNDPNCLINKYPNQKIPRNKMCEATGKKFKRCCGGIA
jgi:preprotein translocase subunit SecA